jgi:hypothetical protein
MEYCTEHFKQIALTSLLPDNNILVWQTVMEFPILFDQF